MNRKESKNVIDSINLKAKSSTIEGVRYTNQLQAQQNSNCDSRNLNLGIPSTVQNNTPSVSLLRKTLEHRNIKFNDKYTTEITIDSLLPVQAAPSKNEPSKMLKLPSFINSFKTASSHSFEALVNMQNFGNSTLPVEQHQFTKNESLQKIELPKKNLQSKLFNDAHVDKITTQGSVDQNSKSISSCSKKQTFKSSVFDDKSQPEASCNLLNDSQNVNSKSKFMWHHIFKKNYSINTNTTQVNKLNESKLLNKIDQPNALEQNRDNLSNKFQPLLLNQVNKTTQHSSKKTPYIISLSSATGTTDISLTNKVITNEVKQENLNCETSNVSNLTEHLFYQKQLTENCSSHKINVNELNKNNVSNKLEFSQEELQLKNTQINIQSARQTEAKEKTIELDVCLNEIDEKWENKRKRDDEPIELCINNEVQSEMKKIKIAPDNVPFKSGSLIKNNSDICNYNFEEQTKNLKNNSEMTSINVNSSETRFPLIYKSNNDGEVSTSKQLIQWKNTTVPDHKAGPFNISARDNIILSNNTCFKVNNEKIQTKTNIGCNEHSNNPAFGINKKHVSNSDHLTFESHETNSKISINILCESPVKRTKYDVYSTENKISLIKTKKEILIDAYNKLCNNENFMTIKKQIADIFQKGHNIKKPLLKLQDIEMKINSGDILDFSDLENEILFVVSNAIMYQKISSPVYEMASNLRLEIKNYFQLLQDEIDINEFDQIEKRIKKTNTEELNFNYGDFNFDCKNGILNSLNEWINYSSDESSADESSADESSSDESSTEDSDESSAEDSDEISFG